MYGKPIGNGQYTHDEEAKVEYIYVLPWKGDKPYPEAAKTIAMRPGLNIDLDSYGDVIGIEILS